MTCATCGERDAVKGPDCYRCYLKTVGFNYGHLRNRLYPGEPVGSTERIIREEAHKKGEDAIPADWA